MAAVPVLDRLAGTVPDGFGAMVQLMREMVVKSAASMRVMGPLYAGRAARRDGRPDEAAALEGQALAAVDSAGADAPFLRAVVLGTVGRKEEATAIVDQLVRDGLDPSYIAALYQRLDAPERALAALPPVDAPSERPWEASALRAQTLAATGRIAEAAEHADRGIEAFETALARYARDVLKTSATEDLDGADLYLTRILADAPAAAVGDVEALRRSFATSDRARSVSNSERIESTRSEPAVRRWLALGSRWAAAYEDLGNMVTSLDDVDVDVVRRRLRHVEDELDDAEDKLLAVDPELLAASRRRRPPLDIDAVAAALPAGAVLLQYHLWNDELLAWAMTAGGLRFQRQEVDGADLASDARRFLLAAGGSAALDDALDGRLAALLVDPWATELEAHERIVVVPHGALSVVPFHLLTHAGGRLGERHVLSYAPAAAHLPRLAAPAAPTARSFVLGDPAYAPDRQLRRLPGSGVEARAVQAALGVDRVHLDVGAARDVVLAEAPGSPLLHLATHGLLDERGPNRAYLALAGVDELTVADLLALDIEGAFVVLSACNSGRGRATAGGDVVGLIRAVLASGAGSALASLWPVDDEVGCLLMARFYEHLVAEGDAAAALHRASNDVRLTSPADRHAAYEELAAHFGTSGAPAGRRDVTATEPHSQVGDSAAWAPFVYVGR
ncbi:MAG: CHAT domain-containing protein [Acidimicrobiia bacterium]|nr:CHAT domain-containing protein [Acidimicrobiia bacterium]